MAYGMIGGGCDFNVRELEMAIKTLSRENAMEEEEVIAEYLIALEGEIKREVVKLMREVLNGREVHVE